ncbi:MAG: aminotransferase class III-fold pyridoxal phosphate-dependent enzyme [Proteobacteria bacterium]|nr:aminotransferase class III-fold pyridoxal phosphate-dependent enzyme [Pseudomonadota bacterium]
MNDVQRKAPLPGPKARSLIERDKIVVSPSYVRDYPFVMQRGRGAEVWDVDGNRFVDFASGIAVCSTGHSHPDVVAAIKSAAEQFLHISCDYWHQGVVDLAEMIAALDPVSGPAMSFFANSGTEAVEAALKLARQVTGRGRYIAFLGGFHGRTMGSLAFTASKYTQQRGYFPAMPGVVHVPYPNPYRPLFAGEDQGRAVLGYIEMLFERNLPANEVAAVLIEPIQGEGGYIVPPPGFLAGLRALCDKHGICLIFDEVQAGIGRTGKMFAWQHEGVRPDMITLAKGLGSGLPIGLMVGARKYMEKWPPGSHANTFGGNPVCCAAALACPPAMSAAICVSTASLGGTPARRSCMRRACSRGPAITGVQPCKASSSTPATVAARRAGPGRMTCFIDCSQSAALGTTSGVNIPTPKGLPECLNAETSPDADNVVAYVEPLCLHS